MNPTSCELSDFTKAVDVEQTYNKAIGLKRVFKDAQECY
jgi:hypothetical protein